MAEAGDGSGHTPLTPEWTLHPVPLITHGRETDRTRRVLHWRACQERRYLGLKPSVPSLEPELVVLGSQVITDW